MSTFVLTDKSYDFKEQVKNRQSLTKIVHSIMVKAAELDVLVAADVGVRGPSLLILFHSNLSEKTMTVSTALLKGMPPSQP